MGVQKKVNECHLKIHLLTKFGTEIQIQKKIGSKVPRGVFTNYWGNDFPILSKNDK